MKYFSELSSKKKDETINNILIIANKLDNLTTNLALKILIDSGIYFEQRQKVNELIKGKKIFKHGKNYYPLNISQIFNCL